MAKEKLFKHSRYYLNPNHVTMHVFWVMIMLIIACIIGMALTSQ